MSIRLREGMKPLSAVRAMVINYYGTDAQLTQTGPDTFTVRWTDKRRGHMEDVVEVELR